MKEKMRKAMLEKYREDFERYLDRDKRKVLGTRSGQAYSVALHRHELLGTVRYMNELGAITEEEWEKLVEEINREFDTEKMLGFGSYLKAEVYEI